jgi:pyruvate dehydrogenase E1 component
MPNASASAPTPGSSNPPSGIAAEGGAADEALLRAISQRVLWLSTAIVDAANRGRPNSSGVKVGGHQASSASMVDIMVALWFHSLGRNDRVSVKPHASPVLHAVNYLLGDLDASYLSSLRAKGGLQSYPSRLKDPDTVDFSTGSVGIGATAALWAAMAHRYVASHFPSTPAAGRFISLLGDAELDEGAVWEAVADPQVASLGELLWVVDLNRQSLDRVVPDIQSERLQGMFTAAGWQVLTLKWGRFISEIFEHPGGRELRRRLEEMPNEEYQRMLRVPAEEIAARILADQDSAELQAAIDALTVNQLATAIRDLGGHDLGLLTDTFDRVDEYRPTVVFAYTVKGRGLATEGHPNNHSALLTEGQLRALAEGSGVSVDDPWATFAPGTAEATLCRARATVLRRPTVAADLTVPVPRALGHPHRKPVSTQAALGRLLADLVRDAPEAAPRLVTCSPMMDVATASKAAAPTAVSRRAMTGR